MLKPSYLQLLNNEDEPEPESEENYALIHATTEPVYEPVPEPSIWDDDMNIEINGMFYYVDEDNRGGQWWDFDLKSAVENGFITAAGTGKLYIYITSLNGFRLLCSLFHAIAVAR